MPFIKDNKRINIHAPYESEDGTRYADLTDSDVQAELGISWVDDPAPPEGYSEDTHYRTEQDTAPYVVYTPKSPEQIATALLSKAKAARHSELATLTVTTQAGNEFDGNEEAQNRMARALSAMDANESIQWVLADNTIATVSRNELREALRLAGQAMTTIWMRPYVV